MIERLEIVALGSRGDGIANGPDGPIYVPCTLPGEIIEVDAWPGHPDRRHLMRVDRASPERVAPVCPHFGICGGCALQHLALNRYREWKRGLVETALQQAGLPVPIDELIDAHGEGRRRATLHARPTSHNILGVGFAAARAHHIVAIDACPVLAPSMAGAIPAGWAIAQILDPLSKPLDLQATATDGGLDFDVRGSGRLTSQITEKLARAAEQHRLARLTRHGEIVVRLAAPTIQIGRANVELPPGSFLQATSEGEATLARLVVQHIGRAREVIDLFCGVGPFALRIAEFARVNAADSDDRAVTALTRAAAATKGLKPVAAHARDLFRRPYLAQELRGDAVVFDPPRQGAEAQAREIAKSAAPVVVAVSCNPATFARDARLLSEGGYRLVQVTPVDQFRYSFHVEVVAKFVRSK
jgi:23S rRNA (uracil1939-C5)-methyltransferase